MKQKEFYNIGPTHLSLKGQITEIEILSQMKGFSFNTLPCLLLFLLLVVNVPFEGFRELSQLNPHFSYLFQ